MEGEKMMKASALMELGFSKHVAAILSYEEVPDNAQVRQNIELLGQFVDLGKLEKPLYGIPIFLKRQYVTNQFMASIPERYEFAPQEREEYLSHPHEWVYEFDLKDELDEQLRQISDDKEWRMMIYRELYLGKIWLGSEIIRSSCQAMLEAANNTDEVKKLLSGTPSFFFRKGTVRYIRVLQAHFKPEAVWKIFEAHALCVVYFDDPELDFEKSFFQENREWVIKELKEKYPEDVKTVET